MYITSAKLPRDLSWHLFMPVCGHFEASTSVAPTDFLSIRVNLGHETVRPTGLAYAVIPEIGEGFKPPMPRVACLFTNSLLLRTQLARGLELLNPYTLCFWSRIAFFISLAILGCVARVISYATLAPATPPELANSCTDLSAVLLEICSFWFSDMLRNDELKGHFGQVTVGVWPSCYAAPSGALSSRFQNPQALIDGFDLFINDRHTGKSTIAIDSTLNQSGCICTYVDVGQKESTVTEHFMYLGKATATIYNDLTNTQGYREMCLLLRKPPSREAYPDDVFHLYARLLERAAKLNYELGGGSMTYLPIRFPVGSYESFLSSRLSKLVRVEGLSEGNSGRMLPADQNSHFGRNGHRSFRMVKWAEGLDHGPTCSLVALYYLPRPRPPKVWFQNHPFTALPSQQPLGKSFSIRVAISRLKWSSAASEGV